MPLQPVSRSSSVSDAVFAQLLDGVLSGELAEELPAERALTQALGVNRQAVREALQRLAAAGLVEIRHGGRTRVRDYRQAAGLDLLPRLLVAGDGSVDAEVATGLMELRSCLGTDAARLCAQRAPANTRAAIVAVAADMADAAADLGRLAVLDLQFWDAVIDGAGNIAYRLAFNGLRQTYEPIADLLRDVLAAELTDHGNRQDLVAGIEGSDEAGAAAAAQRLLAGGEAAVRALVVDLGAVSTLKERA